MLDARTLVTAIKSAVTAAVAKTPTTGTLVTNLYNSDINLITKAGNTLFEDGSQALTVTFDGKPERLHPFLSALENRAEQAGMRDIMNVQIHDLAGTLLTKLGWNSNHQESHHWTLRHQAIRYWPIRFDSIIRPTTQQTSCRQHTSPAIYSCTNPAQLPRKFDEHSILKRIAPQAYIVSPKWYSSSISLDKGMVPKLRDIHS